MASVDCVLTTDQKGAVVELAIAHRAAQMGIGVWSAYTVERFDLVFDLGPTKNKQKVGVNWAADYEFEATLGPHQGP